MGCTCFSKWHASMTSGALPALQVEDKQMDQSKVQSAMATLTESQKADKDAQRQR